MDILFIGATGTVTGSKFLVTSGSKKILVDCGLFQGWKQLRERNWTELPVKPSEIDAVLLTHAHLDHSGYLPVLARDGFDGPVYATESTRDLCDILLRDSGRIQEEEANYARRRRYSKHAKPKPLYTENDAKACLRLFRTAEYEENVDLGGGVDFSFVNAGHILGSAFVALRGEGKKVLFTGDIGRPGMPIMEDPSHVTEADYLLVESTYGRRRHDEADPEDQIAEIVARTVARRGIVLIPSFAVARAQMLLAYIHRLKVAKRIPDVPVFLNSPMATNVTETYVRHHDDHRLTAEECKEIFSDVTYVRSVDESKALNRRRDPMIVISSSGMATGGRVLHHLKEWAGDPKNTLLFVGFQAGGTRGSDIVDGAESVKIHGQHVPIRAEVTRINSLSAHADYEDTLAWMGHFKKPPRCTFLVHGEPDALDSMRKHVEERLHWNVRVPYYRERIVLGDD